MFGAMALILLAGFCAGERPAHSRVLLSDLTSLRFRAGRKTTSRIGEEYPQLQLLPGSAPGAPPVSEVYCTNQGRDGSGIIWECTTNELPLLYSLGRTEVSCEGWNGPGDEYIVRGSCLLKYQVVDNPEYSRYSRESVRRERNLERAARYEERAADASREAARWARDAWDRWAQRPWWAGGWDDFVASWGSADPATTASLVVALVVYRLLVIGVVVGLAIFVCRRIRRFFRRHVPIRARRAADDCADGCAEDCCACCGPCCAACCGNCADDLADAAVNAAAGTAAATVAGTVAGAVAGARAHVPPRFYGPRWFYPHSNGFYYNQDCGCPACREFYMYPGRRSWHARPWGAPAYVPPSGPTGEQIRAEREARQYEREAREHEREAARLRREADKERERRERAERTKHESTSYATTTTR